MAAVTAMDLAPNAVFMGILHGTEDQVVPYESAKKLFNASPKPQTKFITIEGGSHGDLRTFDSYHHHIKKMLE